MSGNDRRLAVLFLICLAWVLPLPAGQAERAEERAPAVAGRFYPGDADQLVAAVRAYLQDAVTPAAERPLALVVPHAGYIYSGQIAADGYRQAMPHEYDLVVILGTNHTTAGFHGVSVYLGEGYRTPLGLARIDGEVARKLIAADPEFVFEPRVHRREHSVEVQVPFVQVAFPGVEIVSAVIGRPDPGLCRRFGKALARVLEGRKALIVASSDLSHYPAYDDAVAADRAVVAAMSRLDPAELRAAIKTEMRRGRPGLSTCACGEAPVLAAMVAARELGATRGRSISYANSGDSAMADHSRVVGYAALAMVVGEAGTDARVPPAHADPPPDADLDAAQKIELLRIARSSIERYLATGTAPLVRGCPRPLEHRQGVFVTLLKDGQLRGCIGRMSPDLPRCQVVEMMALQAAFNDRRFQPLRPEELDEIEIEISLLTPLRKVSGPEAVVVGRDGVRLSKDGRGAVYLPHVAVEQGWDRDEMLDHLCRKAGLPVGSWRDGAEFWTFQAEVFRESDAG